MEAEAAKRAIWHNASTRPASVEYAPARAYGDAINRLGDNAEARKLLQDVQGAGIAVRDGEGAFSSSGVGGGSAYPMIQATGLKHVTDRRVAASISNARRGDLSCPVPAK
ncbi:hypothetical protein ACHMW7_07385 [Aminobacter sp. UC22_36]|uniref:hypothetical protein n=1 Tax=Aminobacter sp. UC22_36 TaxID=3374549 RepID=UPI003756C902